jgi:uncharacterized protein (DUF1501 family)
VLVILELGGGNDGLSTLVPFEDEGYRRLRPTLALGASDVIDLGDGLGLNRRLADLHESGLAIVSGVGAPKPSLSHFEMLERWWTGVPQGLTDKQKSEIPTGFLGRLCDHLQGDEQFTGVSMRVGGTTALRSAKAATTSLRPGGPIGDLIGPDGKAFTTFIRRSSRHTAGGALGAAQVGAQRLLWIDDMLASLPEVTTKYPDSDLGRLLSLGMQVLRSGNGVRVLHIPFGESSFDTHDSHGTVHPELLDEMNAAMAAFLSDLKKYHLDDRVLVATISEFGRRVEEHNGGLDHGAASMAMMLGPVVAGVHGEPSPIDDLDELGDLKSTVSFGRYFATMAEWMQVEPSAVLAPGDDGKVPTAIDGILA